MKKYIGIVFCLLFSGIASAQYSDFGILAGGAYYLGDINPKKHLYSMNYNYGFFLRYTFNDWLALRAQASFMKLRADDLDFDNPYQQTRGYAFETKVSDLSTILEIHFLTLTENERDENFTPYIATGVGYAVAPSGSTGSNLEIPFHLGFKLRLNRSVVAGGEWVFHKTFTDYLDKLENDPNATDITKQRFFADNNDHFFTINLYLSFKIYQKGSYCPAFKSYGIP